MGELEKCPANYCPLTPVQFLERAAQVYPQRPALIYGSSFFTWADTLLRCTRLASALRHRCAIRTGDTVSVVAPNVPAMYEAHFAIPMAGAIINCINIRLDARTISFLLQHSDTKVIVVDQEFFALVVEALQLLEKKQGSLFKCPILIVVEDENCPKASLQAALEKGAWKYEDVLEFGDPAYQWSPPADEWDSISLSYTSGTTSDPKGVVASHRGAYIASLTACLVWGLKEGCVYLWTLPLFHCNGWCYSWAIAAVAGTNVCLRQVTAKGIYSAIANHGVTHFCAAPIVLNTIINAPPSDRLPIKAGVQVMTAGAAPPVAVLEKMEMEGFQVTHTYGLTETYGPSTICAWKTEWDAFPLQQRAQLKARQGVRYTGLEGLDVVYSGTVNPIPADGTTIGEIVMRGNMVMKGYLKNPEATRKCFQGGWFHSGDLGVKHPDSYIEIKDREKDIIISGGENISSLEVENILYQHPNILEACVVAQPDEKWGEVPCAFIALKPGIEATSNQAKEILEFCKAKLPHFMAPKAVIFSPLPKTATGKIQKHVLRAQVKRQNLPRSKL
ncbi:hypothetical protein L7F22_060455 [Adiantum nelumboides]|nr:hypothetical protein [Adiantum nelumboides]